MVGRQCVGHLSAWPWVGLGLTPEGRQAIAKDGVHRPRGGRCDLWPRGAQRASVPFEELSHLLL